MPHTRKHTLRKNRRDGRVCVRARACLCADCVCLACFSFLGVFSSYLGCVCLPLRLRCVFSGSEVCGGQVGTTGGREGSLRVERGLGDWGGGCLTEMDRGLLGGACLEWGLSGWAGQPYGNTGERQAGALELAGGGGCGEVCVGAEGGVGPGTAGEAKGLQEAEETREEGVQEGLA